MAAPSGSMSLVPSSQISAQFAQTGTVDWTSLSEMTFSASVGVLGRLSKAGLEPITVAIAQAMSMSLQVGVHGERKLAEAMSSLKSFSSFGDAIFFGIGVRHILRTLVQTSQGASSVAMVAALTEGHSTMYTAYVLYEMTKITKSPAELTPSYAQWERYAETCAGLFSTSIFGQKIRQLSLLCGFVSSADRQSKTNAACPADMAMALCAIGNVQSGRVKAIDIVGGPSCCWLAVFCEFILDLGVEIRLIDGTLVFTSVKKGEHTVDHPQVRFQIGVSGVTQALAAVGQTISVSSEEFVARWHRSVDPSLSAMTGRLDRDFILRDSFKNTTGILMRDSSGSVPFSKMVASAAVFYCHSRLASRYPAPVDFVLKAMISIPELRSIRELLLEEAEKMETAGLLQAANQYDAACMHIKSLQHTPDYTVCETIIILAFLLGETLLDDGIHITSFGIRHIYKEVSKQSYKNISTKDAEAPSRIIPDTTLPNSRFENLGIGHVAKQPTSIGNESKLAITTRMRLFLVNTSEHTDAKFAELFDILIVLFTGFPAPLSRDKTRMDDHYISATCSGGIYFYIDVLRNLGSDYATSSSIHIGRGCIQSSGHIYPSVLDTIRPMIWEGSFLTSDIPPELLDVSNGQLSVEGVVEERVVLSFSYRVHNRIQSFDIGPTRFLRALGWNYHYRADGRLPWPSSSMSPDFSSNTSPASSSPMGKTFSGLFWRHSLAGKPSTRWRTLFKEENFETLRSLVGVRDLEGNTILRCLLTCEYVPGRSVIDGLSDLQFLTWATILELRKNKVAGEVTETLLDAEFRSRQVFY